MSEEVQFDIDTAPRSENEPEAPRITQWVIKHSRGFIKNEEQANYALLGLVIFCFIFIFYIIFGTSLFIESLPKTSGVLRPGQQNINDPNTY